MLRNCFRLVSWLTVTAFLIEACAGPPQTGTESQFLLRAQDTPDQIMQTLKEQGQLYDKTVQYCQSQLESIRGEQKGLSYWLIGIGVLGAAFGSAGSALLAASAANKATAAFFSSGAGVAAGVQPIMAKQGETPDVYRTAYNKLVDQLHRDAADWGAIPLTHDRTQIERRQLLIERMNAHCKFISFPASLLTPTTTTQAPSAPVPNTQPTPGTRQ